MSAQSADFADSAVPADFAVSIRIKRAYAPAEEADGTRLLVDRLWPRGVSKERAHLDDWWKQIAPTPELRKWFGHDPAKFEEFAAKYRQELDASDFANERKAEIRSGAFAATVTLVYAAKDESHNHALVLKDWLEE